MNTEVVAVGTELLLGPVVDTNSTWIGERLAENGIDSFLHTVVGDNHARIVEALRVALSRSDAVVVTGGLGPTQDDITRAAMAEAMGVELVFDQEVADKIEKIFTDRGRQMAANNALQAWRPEGSKVIEQNGGTAPGLICEVGDKIAFLLPGVPWEMKDMMDRAVLPELRERAGEASVILSRTLRTWGSSESAVAETLDEHLRALDAPDSLVKLAFLAKGIEGIHVRATAKDESVEVARDLLDHEEAALRELLGDLVFGVDEQTMEFAVGEQLKRLGLTMSVAESMTGGLVASRITETPGSSDWFRGGVVSYASEVKYDVLDVPVGPVVSEAAAKAMAEGVCKVIGTHVGVGITGVAGPAEQEGQPVGTVFAGIAVNGQTSVLPMKLHGNRQMIREIASINVLNELRRQLAVL